MPVEEVTEAGSQPGAVVEEEVEDKSEAISKPILIVRPQIVIDKRRQSRPTLLPCVDFPQWKIDLVKSYFK